MKILSFTKEAEDTEQMFVTEINHKGITYVLASYVYNGDLAENETNPSYWNTDIFQEIPENEQQKIKDLVNENLLKNYH